MRWTFAARSIAPGSPLVSGMKVDARGLTVFVSEEVSPHHECADRAPEHQCEGEVDEDEAATVGRVPGAFGSARLGCSHRRLHRVERAAGPDHIFGHASSFV